MKKGIALIPVLFLMLLIGGGIILGLKFQPGKNSESKQQPTLSIQSTPIIETPSQSLPQPTSSVPLPTEEDIVRNFFALINEKKPSEAVGMMSSSNTADDSQKQAWAVQFNDIKSINVQKIEPSMPESWTENRHIYKVTLEAYVSSDAADEPIPYYGWHDNPNIRWVGLVKENGLWKIEGLATGP